MVATDLIPTHLVVFVVILNQEGKVLLIQRSTDDPGGDYAWEYPGGGVKLGETLTDAAKREVREEVNLSVTIYPTIIYEKVKVIEGGHRIILGLVGITDYAEDKVILTEEHTDCNWISHPDEVPNASDDLKAPLNEELLKAKKVIGIL